MENFFKGRTVLVTGGSGSFGRVIVQRLLELGPRVVRVFSRDESKHFEMRRDIGERPDVRYLVGDIRDKERLLRAMEDVEVVYHAAGLKHVVSCEYNPFEAVKTNVIGTQNVIDAAMEVRASKVIFTSTDKAVNPCNTMGASKLMAEKLVTAANQYRGSRSTIFATVRFGNVLGSRGSVVPHFQHQLRTKRKITVTNPDMTRYVMNESHAVDLVLSATGLAQGGEIFILKMPALRVGDLAEVMVESYAAARGLSAEAIEVETIGALPGEKMYEELMTPQEQTRALELPDMFVVKPPVTDLIKADYIYPEATEPSVARYTSNDERLLTKKEIRRILQEAGLIGDDMLAIPAVEDVLQDASAPGATL
jgi:FlaA1/EpsC-like NDP-sugar epimerase